VKNAPARAVAGKEKSRGLECERGNLGSTLVRCDAPAWRGWQASTNLLLLYSAGLAIRDLKMHPLTAAEGWSKRPPGRCRNGRCSRTRELTCRTSCLTRSSVLISRIVRSRNSLDTILGLPEWLNPWGCICLCLIRGPAISMISAANFSKRASTSRNCPSDALRLASCLDE
jgi:hypothetical protein